MSDNWIDKTEIDELIFEFVSGASQQPEPPRQPAPLQVHDAFSELAAVRPQSFQPAPATPVAAPSPGTKPKFESPFTLDEDEEEDDDGVELAAKEMQQSAAIDRDSVSVPDSEVVSKSQDEGIRDRIPIDVEIDSDLSINHRLAELASILETYVGMKEMIVADQHGFSLFQSVDCDAVKASVNGYLNSIRKVYETKPEPRSHNASQIALPDGNWLCMIAPDGEISSKFLLKALLEQPLDRPEIYIVVELLNEVLRPDSSLHKSP